MNMMKREIKREERREESPKWERGVPMKITISFQKNRLMMLCMEQDQSSSDSLVILYLGRLRMIWRLISIRLIRI
jgi:hypothetical protein